MRPLFITIAVHDKIAQYILILIGSDVLKTELDVISVFFFIIFLVVNIK